MAAFCQLQQPKHDLEVSNGSGSDDSIIKLLSSTFLSGQTKIYC